ncbi:MAG TPA: anti-sigma factor [Chitinophagaceae bacterium]|nr:anti-sigma factor [Chitinophagaceae bacterium]
MNIKEYISSGVVESYVLGLLTAQERFEFEQYCEAYPELKAARNAFELVIEKQAMENAVPPPSYVKEKILAAIQQKAAPNPSKLIKMEPATTRRSPGFGWLAAASVLLFLVTGYFAYTFYNQNKELKSSNNELEAKISRTDSIMNKMLEDQRAINDPNVMVVNMVGTQKASPGSASIYWDSTSTNVYLVVKNMPKLATDKQYQLWAMIDGKPVDLGLFDQPQPNVILKMKNTQKADAFAITIESRGNTGGPNLEQLQSMGKAKL